MIPGLSSSRRKGVAVGSLQARGRRNISATRKTATAAADIKARARGMSREPPAIRRDVPHGTNL
jgi:hypothetical protein